MQVNLQVLFLNNGLLYRGTTTPEESSGSTGQKGYVPTTLGTHWICIGNVLNLAGFNTFPSAYPIDSQVVGTYVFVQ